MTRVASKTFNIESVIQTVRGEKVILDVDLARIYGIPTKRLNEQVSRNARRFPADFAFRLSKPELALLIGQIANSKLAGTGRKLRPVPKGTATRVFCPMHSPSTAH